METMKRKPKSDKKRLTVYLPAKLYKQFRQQAKYNKFSASWYMQQLMEGNTSLYHGEKF